MFINKWRRYPYYDYNQIGYYFVTICTKNRINYFGSIKEQTMVLSNIGAIAEKCWQEIPGHFSYISIEDFVIMPNHVHGIIIVHDEKNPRPNDRTKMNLSKVIQQYKSSVTRRYRRSATPTSPAAPMNLEFNWQRSFHDRVIRNEDEHNRIAEYIQKNIENYDKDIYNSSNLCHNVL